MEGTDLLTLLQGGSVPVMGVIGYLLWKLNSQMSELKTSVDTLIETLIRFVPGITEKKPGS